MKKIEFKRNVEFIGVDFKYPNLDKPSLKNLNLEIKKIVIQELKGPQDQENRL